LYQETSNSKPDLLTVLLGSFSSANATLIVIAISKTLYTLLCGNLRKKERKRGRSSSFGEREGKGLQN